MDELRLLLELLLLLMAANGAPVLAAHILKDVADWPVDCGRYASDGERLLGVSKTWRGVFSAVLATMVVAYLLGYPVMLGAQLGLFAMLGDMVSSFIKRRVGLTASARAFGLDQIPEAVLPLWVLHEQLELGWTAGFATVIIFLLSSIGLSKLLYRLHIRKQPY
ncbi:MAG: CDP-archaeol synthase [Pseudomonadota bacterium]